MGACTLAVGSCPVNNHDHSIGRQPAVSEDTGDEPAFQADVIVAARKADIGEAKAQAGWSLDDRFGGLVDELLGDVARDPHVPNGQQSRQGQDCGDGALYEHANRTRSPTIWSRSHEWVYSGTAVAKKYALTGSTKAFNAFAKSLLRLGIPTGNIALLTVPGRQTGQPRSTVVNLHVENGRRYLVSPYGQVGWVQNVRAAGGRARIRSRGRTEDVRLQE